MKRWPLVRKTARDWRMSVVSVGVVMFLLAVLYIVIYPEYRDMLQDMELPAAFDVFLGEAGSIATPEGFLSAEYFSWVPLILITVAIIAGTGTVAGEESAGTLDLLLALPIRRWRVLTEKTAGVAVALIGAALLAYPGFLLGKLFVDFPLSNLRLAEAVANMLPVAILYLAISVALAAAIPGRTLAAVGAAGLVIAAYFLNTVAAAVSSFSELRKASPFYWSDGSRVLIHGFDFGRAGLLLGVAALVFVFALWAFERRDIGRH
jgi:ABC-2 type transport system permease protein